MEGELKGWVGGFVDVGWDSRFPAEVGGGWLGWLVCEAVGLGVLSFFFFGYGETRLGW